MHSPCFYFTIVPMGEGGHISDNNNDGDGTVNSFQKLSDEEERDHPSETLLLLRVPEGRAAYLTLGELLSMADDDGDGDVKTSAERRRGTRMMQQRRLQQVPIIPTRNPPLPLSDG